MKSAVAAVFAVFALAGVAAAQEECRLTLAASLPISPESVDRVIIPAQVEGKPVQLVIDTGSPWTALSGEAAARLGLNPTFMLPELRPRFPYAGGQVTHSVNINEFKLGGMTAPRAKLMILPHALEKGDGLLGADFLHQFDVEFDFAAGKVNLFRPHPCPGKVVYWTHTAPVAVIPFESGERGGKIRIEYTLDGQRVPAIVDTGAPNTSISLTTASAWFHIDEKSPGVTDLHERAFRYRFKTLALDGVVVQNPELLIHQKADGGHTMDFQALLGLNILRQLHLYVAYQEHKLYVTAASAH